MQPGWAGSPSDPALQITASDLVQTVTETINIAPWRSEAQAAKTATRALPSGPSQSILGAVVHYLPGSNAPH